MVVISVVVVGSAVVSTVVVVAGNVVVVSAAVMVFSVTCTTAPVYVLRRKCSENPKMCSYTLLLFSCFLVLEWDSLKRTFYRADVMPDAQPTALKLSRLTKQQCPAMNEIA